jgi:WD40 repeat protein
MNAEAGKLMQRYFRLMLCGWLMGSVVFSSAQEKQPTEAPKGRPPAASPPVQPPQTVSPQLTAEVERWCSLLAHSDFHRREEATQNLIRIGPAALVKLQTLAKSEDADLRYRAEELIKIVQSKAMGATQVLTDHEEFVRTVVYSPDGSRLASAGGGTKQNNTMLEGSDFTIRIWNTRTWEKVQEIAGHKQAVNQLDWSRDGNWLVSASEDGSARVWSVATGEEHRALRGHEDRVMRAMFTQDAKEVITATPEGTVRSFNVETGKLVRSFAACTVKLNSLHLAPQGVHLAVCGEEASLRLFNASTSEPVRTLEKHKQRVLALQFSPDGEQLLTGGGDSSVRIWHVASGEQKRVFNATNEAFNCVAWSADQRLIATATNREKIIQVYEVATGKQLRMFKGHRSLINQLAFSPDGLSLVSCSHDKTIRVWPLLGATEEVPPGQ